MEAGKLRHKITIKHLLNTESPSGASKKEWVDFATVRASKEQLIGNEYFKAEQAQSQVEVKFRTRYISGITNDMRILHGAELYTILSAIDIESRGRELLIYCKKVV